MAKGEITGKYDRLNDIWQVTITVQNVVIIVCFLIIMAIDIFIIVQSLRRHTYGNFPYKVKLTLAGYLVVTGLGAIVTTRMLIEDSFESIFNQMFDRVCIALASSSWFSIHWLFTSYYLQTACLFRMTFRAQTESDFKKVRRRKLCLIGVEYIVLALLLGFLIFLIIKAGEGRE